MFCIFSCAHLLSIYFLWRNVCLNIFSHFFNRVVICLSSYLGLLYFLSAMFYNFQCVAPLHFFAIENDIIFFKFHDQMSLNNIYQNKISSRILILYLTAWLISLIHSSSSGVDFIICFT